MTKTQWVCHLPVYTKHHDLQRIMQSFNNLAEGTVDEAFTKKVHIELHQIRVLRHNRENLCRLIKFLGLATRSDLDFNRYSYGNGNYFMGRPDIFSPDLKLVWDFKPKSNCEWASGVDHN